MILNLRFHVLMRAILNNIKKKVENVFSLIQLKAKLIHEIMLHSMLLTLEPFTQFHHLFGKL